MRKSQINKFKILIIGITMFMLGSNIVSAQVSVNLPALTRQQGDAPEWINVTVGNLTGQNITAFQFTLFYNKNIISIDSAICGPVAAGGLFAFNADTANQQVKVAFATAYALSGSGTLLKLKVHYKNIGTSTLSLNDTFQFNAGNPPVSVEGGSIIINGQER